MKSISRRGARVLSLVVSLALVPVLAQGSSASADQLRYRDATQDVAAIDLADETLTPVIDPTATNGDIRDVFVHYRAGRLVIRANYVDLRPRRDTSLIFTGEIRTNEKRRWLYQVTTTPPRHAGHDELVTYRNFRRACEIGHRIDYRENFTRVVVPLRCLSNPRWVKVSVGAATIQLDEEALKEFLESDDEEIPAGLAVVRADDSTGTEVLDQLGLTPRIYR